MLEEINKRKRERQIERESTMNVFLLPSQKQKNIIHQLTTFSTLFSSVVWSTKEILVNMWNINIFIIILLILNYETSGKQLYLSRIESDPLKNNIIRLQFWLDVADQRKPNHRL
jgi:hypothetical protein